jgi:S-adenosylmethionine:tRNA-ribosyltransferase-isomerase (queuine synthetase)
MAKTYEKIATTTASGSTASITFSSIASTYTDIVLISNAKATVAGTNLMFRLNSDSGSNYSATLLKGNGSTASSYRYSNGTDGRIGEYTNAQFGVYITNFQNYSNSTTYKTVLTRSNSANDHTSAWVNLWRSTSAVNSISVVSDGGNIESGSTFTLYGIKAA